MKCALKPLTENRLELVLKWRNSDRVRKNMYNDRIITIDEHIQWYNTIKERETEKYFLFYIDTTPLGLIYFNNIDYNHRHSMWGFYIGEEQSPRGSGMAMGYLGLNYAFDEIVLNKVYGEVLSYNETSKRFHEKLGFVREGFFKQHIRKGKQYQDIFRYSLFQKEWFNIKVSIRSKLIDKGMKIDN